MKTLTLTTLMLCSVLITRGQVPGTMSYQGILITSGGQPVADGAHTITFNFYTAESGGSAAISRGPFTVNTYKGMLTFLIGSGSPSGNAPFAFDATHPGNNQYYVEVVADGSSLPGRVQLSSVPYAFRAYDATQVVNGAITGTTAINTTVDIGTSANLNIGGTTNVKGPLSLGITTNLGTAGQVLTSQGSGAPVWTTPTSGGWGLTGNSGTSAATSFIGTTDNIPVSFRVNNVKSGRIDQAGNSFFGVHAGELVSTGQANTAIGSDALAVNTTGNANIAIGSLAMWTNVGGTQGTAVGHGAMQYVNSSGNFLNQSVAVGYEALRGSITPADNTGNQNTALGFQALLNNNTGSSNTAVGLHGMASNTSGSGNISQGHAALTNNTTGSNNVALGLNALYSNVAGERSTAVGTFAQQFANNTATPGYSNTNVGVGYQALRGSSTPAINTGIHNVAVGTNSMTNNTSGMANVGVGLQALSLNTSGSNNVAIGSQSLENNTTAFANTAIGTMSLFSNSTGTANVAIGHEALMSATGSSNLAVGYNAGHSTTSGSFNHFVGYSAGYSSTTTSSNHFEGYEAGYSNTSGDGNYFSGFNAGRANTTGFANHFSGYQAGTANTTGQYNQFAGWRAGFANTTGSSNYFIGHSAGLANTTGYINHFTGFQAGQSNTTGNNNHFDGYAAGFSNTTAVENTFIGNQSGRSNTTGSSNHFVGFNAGYSNTTGGSNYFSGWKAGYSNTTGSNNHFEGYNPGYWNTTGHDNLFIGSGAGFNNTTGNENTFVGIAGVDNTLGNANVFVGYLAGVGNTGGSANTVLGYRAGYTNTPSNANVTGNFNTFIGYNAGPGTASQLTNASAIGANALVSQSNSIVIGGAGADAVKVGIGTSTPGASIHIVSNGTPASGDIHTETNSASDQSSMQFRRSQGTNATPTSVLATDGLGRINFAGHNGTAYVIASIIQSFAETSFNSSINSYLTLHTTQNGTIAERVRITPDGRLGIGVTGPSQALHVVGNARITAVTSGTFSTNLNLTSDGTLTTSTSDVRKKKNIGTIDNALSKVMRLRGVSYHWIDQSDSQQKSLGLIAQEAVQIVPEIVFQNPTDGFLGVNYSQATGLFVEAIKEQQTQIDDLKRLVNELQERLRNLESGEAVNRPDSHSRGDK
jgi:hypothetical protein